jgi:hypothetical protein
MTAGLKRAAQRSTTLTLMTGVMLVVVLTGIMSSNLPDPIPTARSVVTGPVGQGHPRGHMPPGHRPFPTTLFGASVWTNPGETFGEALAREDEQFGALQIVRIYFQGLPEPWDSAKLAPVHRPMILSFKALPESVLSGADDTELTAWFASAPRGFPIYWSYFHEPEDQIAAGEFTSYQYKAAWAHIATLAAAAHNPYLHPTLILMAWDLTPWTGRNWRNYFPGRSVVQYIGWDVYNHRSISNAGFYARPAQLFGRIVRLMNSIDMPWGIAEMGSLLATGDNGVARAAWLRAVASYLEVKGAAWCSYFDSNIGGIYEMYDPSSISAWRSVVSGRIPA